MPDIKKLTSTPTALRYIGDGSGVPDVPAQHLSKARVAEIPEALRMFVLSCGLYEAIGDAEYEKLVAASRSSASEIINLNKTDFVRGQIVIPPPTLDKE